MEINIEKVEAIITEKYENGYEIRLLGEDNIRTMDVLYTSKENVFLQNHNEFYIVVIDRRIMGLISEDLEDINIVKSFTFAHCNTTLYNDNLKYLENKYGITEGLEEYMLNSLNNIIPQDKEKRLLNIIKEEN